jgi:hypothetical protein
VRCKLVTIIGVTLAAMAAASPAYADRIELTTNLGHICYLDSYLSATVNLTAKDVSFGTVTHCDPSWLGLYNTNVDAYLHEEFNGQDEGQVASAQWGYSMECINWYNCAANGQYNGLTAFDYRNYGDGTLWIYSAGSEKNPSGEHWLPNPRCTVYQGGQAVFCAGLSDGSV